MKTNSILKQWKPYEKLVGTKAFEAVLKVVQNFSDEEIFKIVPNIELGTDGPVVRSFIFLTESYVGECRFLKDGEHHFDLSPIGTITNYRVEIGVHEVVTNSASIEVAKKAGMTPPDPEKIVYQKAEVTLTHGEINLETELNYVGDDLQTWLVTLKQVLPVTVLKIGGR